MSISKRDNDTVLISGNNVILDIEGTTTSITFVKDVLFPYVREHLKKFVTENWEAENFQVIVKSLRTQAKEDEDKKLDGVIIIPENGEKDVLLKAVIDNVIWQMDNDRKTKGLKDLQGLIMESGYKKGDLKGHVYEDVEPCLKSWTEQGKSIYIYSSGSVHAQKLLFGHSEKGDLLPFIKGHFDTNVGMKGEKESYKKIVEEMSCHPSEAVFFTDIPKEARAAKEAGLLALLLSREGNTPLTEEDTSDFKVITSFSEIQFENFSKKRKVCDDLIENKSVESCEVSIKNLKEPTNPTLTQDIEKMEVEESPAEEKNLEVKLCNETVKNGNLEDKNAQQNITPENSNDKLNDCCDIEMETVNGVAGKINKNKDNDESIEPIPNSGFTKESDSNSLDGRLSENHVSSSDSKSEVPVNESTLNESSSSCDKNGNGLDKSSARSIRNDTEILKSPGKDTAIENKENVTDDKENIKDNCEVMKNEGKHESSILCKKEEDERDTLVENCKDDLENQVKNSNETLKPDSIEVDVESKNVQFNGVDCHSNGESKDKCEGNENASIKSSTEPTNQTELRNLSVSTSNTDMEVKENSSLEIVGENKNIASKMSDGAEKVVSNDLNSENNMKDNKNCEAEDNISVEECKTSNENNSIASRDSVSNMEVEETPSAENTDKNQQSDEVNSENNKQELQTNESVALTSTTKSGYDSPMEESSNEKTEVQERSNLKVNELPDNPDVDMQVGSSNVETVSDTPKELNNIQSCKVNSTENSSDGVMKAKIPDSSQQIEKKNIVLEKEDCDMNAEIPDSSQKAEHENTTLDKEDGVTKAEIPDSSQKVENKNMTVENEDNVTKAEIPDSSQKVENMNMTVGKEDNVMKAEIPDSSLKLENKNMTVEKEDNVMKAEISDSSQKLENKNMTVEKEDNLMKAEIPDSSQKLENKNITPEKEDNEMNAEIPDSSEKTENKITTLEKEDADTKVEMPDSSEKVENKKTTQAKEVDIKDTTIASEIQNGDNGNHPKPLQIQNGHELNDEKVTPENGKVDVDVSNHIQCLDGDLENGDSKIAKTCENKKCDVTPTSTVAAVVED